MFTAQHVPGPQGHPSPPGLGSHDNRGMHRRERQLPQLIRNGGSQDQGRLAQLGLQVRDPALQGEPLLSKMRPQVRPTRIPACNHQGGWDGGVSMDESPLSDCWLQQRKIWDAQVPFTLEMNSE